MKQFILNHTILGVFIIFAGMTISNIFPVMLFIFPEFFIFLGIYLAKHIAWYIPYLAIILGAIWGEFISFYIGYKFGDKLLKSKFLQKDLAKKYIEKMRKNPIKTLIIGKIIPGVIWLTPILAGFIKMNPLKFFIINSLIISIVITNVFLVWYFGISIAEDYLGEKIYYIVAVLLILFIIYHIFKALKKS